jgi:hypothetical protein
MGSTDYSSYPFFPPMGWGQRHYSKYLASRLVYFNQPVALFSSVWSWLWAMHWEVCVWNLTCWEDAIRLKYFLIFYVFCNAVLASIIQQSLCTCGVGVVSPGRENLSTRRNAEFLLILKQIVCTKQRPS